MPERDGFASGTPCWVDIGSTDLGRGHAFYKALLGWECRDAGPVEETGGYGFYTLGGRNAAGYGPAQDPAGGVWWTSYVSVDDIDATIAAVTDNGGSVLMPPMDVMKAGRMAIFTDPASATLALWQPGEHKGAGVVNEPGALCWNELLTTDLAGARRFYSAVFGWGERNGPDAPYAEFTVGDQVVAGGMAITSDMPADMPPNWGVYFAVGDLEASTEKVGQLGGVVHRPPFEIPGTGRAAVVGGPLGEVFSLFEMAAPAG
ncbi:MAG: VOC family protein [Acidimicrobiales bacterium]